MAAHLHMYTLVESHRLLRQLRLENEFASEQHETEIRLGSPLGDGMSAHKYKIGQAVSFTPGRKDFPSIGRRYEIIRQLPVEGTELLYRIKSKEEPYERVAKESELSRRL